MQMSDNGFAMGKPPPSRLLPLVIVLGLLLDQVLTFGLASMLGRGGGVGVILVILVTLLITVRRHSRLDLILLSTGLIGILVQINSISLNQFYIAAVAALLLYLACSRIKLHLLKTKLFVYSLWIMLLFNILSKLGFDVFEWVSNLEANRATGLYSEPSHLAYYVAVSYLFAVRVDPDAKSPAALPALTLLALNFSLTALLPVILILGEALFHTTRRGVYSYFLTPAAATILIGLLSFNLDYISDRNIFSTADEQSATVQVIVYYYNALVYFITNNTFLGFGPDKFFDAYSDFAGNHFYMSGDLNSTDGSFLFVKLTGELGFITALTILFAFSRRLSKDSVPVLLIFLQYALLRGFGLTSVIPISLLLIAATIPNFGGKRDNCRNSDAP